MSTENGPPRPTSYILGLDLGVASIGWAIVEPAAGSEPGRIVRAGVHLFEAGIDGGKQGEEAAMASGKEQSKATPRRDARQQRRQTWRRTYRKRLVLNRLIKHGLLPEPPHRLHDPAEIDAYLKTLDATLRASWEQEGTDHQKRQVLPYRLRAAAIHRRLEPFEVGRALYHLAQRRGFLSNRKTDGDGDDDDASNGKNDDNSSVVKEGISELQTLMNAAGKETLGEFFASLDPSDPDSRRIRGRWTGRSMYQHEFNRIWDEQCKHHPDQLTDDAKSAVHHAIFHQRPLKSQRHLIAKCSLMPTRRRAPAADRLYQHFRMLQKVNALEVLFTDTGETRRLTSAERQSVIAALQDGDATFSQLRKALGKSFKKARFNFEEGGEKKLTGMRTDQKLRSVFDDRWEELSEREKNAAVEDCLSFERADAMARRARDHWKLSPDDASAFVRLKLEQGYANLSRAAMRRLLPLLEQGMQYATARKQEFPESFASTEPLQQLPPLKEAFKEPLSPAVARALSELRGVINAIIRRYDKPEHIRIELARDLKKGRKRREAISKNISDRRRQRELATETLLRETTVSDPRRSDVERMLLAEECDWHCPFTGRCFGMADLFGQHPTVEVEHIWPFSRSLDDSFLNKTICCVNENRDVKRNRMPAEVYSGERFAEILQRVARFKGDAARIKRERFAAAEMPEGFTARHLVESQYISRKAAEYVALLFGGYSDDESTRRVHVTTGGLTAWLRREWGMHAILSYRDEKDRNDHRHHAVDAIVVALTTQSAVQKLQRAARQADDAGSHRSFAEVTPPFETFLDDARRAVEAIVVSHRQNRKARGKFHKDTIYSKPHPSGKQGESGHRVRKELDKLNEKEIDAIIDPRIRAVVQLAYAKRRQEGAKNPAQAFSEQKHRPQLPHGDRVRKVRIDVSAKPVAVGEGSRSRLVNLQSNHHTVIMAKLNKDGTEKTWVDEPVSLFDAMNRVKDGKPLVSREVPAGYRFKFSLAANDFVELDASDEDQTRRIYRVLSVSKRDIELAYHTDGRTMKDRQQAGDRERVGGSALFKRNARKVHINYLGEVSNAGG
ncbi:MAG: type II CRISPR RNA-guided endonuclease Cas9 [Phycisphaerales bacterium]